MAPLEFQRVCSMNAPKDILHPVLWATKPLSWIKEIILPCPTNTLFYLLFSSLHPAKPTSLDFGVISVKCQKNLPFPALNPGSQSVWWIIPRAAKVRSKEKTLLPGAPPARGRLFLHPVPKEKIFLLGSTAEFWCAEGSEPGWSSDPSCIQASIPIFPLFLLPH